MSKGATVHVMKKPATKDASAWSGTPSLSGAGALFLMRDLDWS